jgi:hypothetical protein
MSKRKSVYLKWLKADGFWRIVSYIVFYGLVSLLLVLSSAVRNFIGITNVTTFMIVGLVISLIAPHFSYAKWLREEAKKLLSDKQ